MHCETSLFLQNLFEIVLIQITIREDDERNKCNSLYIKITIILIYIKMVIFENLLTNFHLLGNFDDLFPGLFLISSSFFFFFLVEYFNETTRKK